VQALSAVDIALHDLAAKQIGKPVYKLLGGARTDKITPYVTLYPGDIFDQPAAAVAKSFEKRIKTAIDQGLRAMKVPLLFGPRLRDRELVPFIRDCRQMAGDDVHLAVDFGYRWQDWQDAAWLLKRIEAYDIYFAEAPLWHDNLHGYARLSAVSPIRIAGAECATSRWEVREWIEVGKVSVVQPSISHSGGFVDMMRIADMCELYGVMLIPHSYATGITDTCNFHLQAATLNVPFVEFRSPRMSHSRLRTHLVVPSEPEFVDGAAALPHKPGLGLELNEALLKEATSH
jgi:L-alanine-DL-glutamate epimerase-like enolase superfamily enzyme